jgi:hypothetical protein
MRKNVSGVVPRSYSGSKSHFMIRVKAQMVTLLDGFFFRVDPNSFSTLALSFSSSLARRENYTPDDWDLYHVLLGRAHLAQRLRPLAHYDIPIHLFLFLPTNSTRPPECSQLPILPD